MSEGERALAAAVIHQAVEDARAPEPSKPSEPSPSKMKAWRNRVRTWRRERDEAFGFLTAETGEWAKSRERWCGLAGIDADAIRDRMLSTQALAA